MWRRRRRMKKFQLRCNYLRKSAARVNSYYSLYFLSSSNERIQYNGEVFFFYSSFILKIDGWMERRIGYNEVCWMAAMGIGIKDEEDSNNRRLIKMLKLHRDDFPWLHSVIKTCVESMMVILQNIFNWRFWKPH